MLYYLISNLKDIFITIYNFKLYLIPGVQIPTKNSGSHVDPSDVQIPSNLGKYHSRREIVRDISITLTNQSLYMPVNQPCWLAIDNA